MTFNEYQEAAGKTAIYPRKLSIVYPLIGLAGETGEVAEKVKKIIRDNDGIFDESEKLEIAKELGDVLWYLSAIAADMGYRLDDIARLNIEKIQSRHERSFLHGNGDNR
ncbi:nucleoside triphosphate pyrophosphohydrolase family protein [Prevotella sp. KH2C16]|uniref:nucleoside triphosphate pyrophosphohydrolase family protein n=1 Tax=Prevotella sp. KH2C16 TaxID=1855325 RepID=UPI0008F333E2|nr:nucleoside triphosphate pyrophosphohydrolase family protein [Prevotella sp. KH2C16]SFG60710.1 NTP pyrophosphatase, house-cleaning of non-canonical NTPs [Prevotella sp. KH2C16]